MRATSPTQRKGRAVERLALEYLTAQGLQLVSRNYQCRMGEIDLIMRDSVTSAREQMAIVEVRYRQSNAYGGAAASITPAKQSRIVRTAQHYLLRHHVAAKISVRFDVLAISGALSDPSIDWIQSAFDA